MRDNENLSVEEILREADEMLNQINSRNRAAEEVKTFTPKSAKPSGLEKTIVSDKTIVSGNTIVSDKTIVGEKVTAKKQYFLHNPSDANYNPRPPQIIERAATIKSKSRFNRTSDLQEIPTILAVEELDRTKNFFGESSPAAEERSENDYDMSDQIKISGFDDEFDEIPVIDEDVAEEQLRQRREDKINKFRLFAKEEIQSAEAQKGIVSNSVYEKGNRTGMLEQFFKLKSNLQLQSVITLIAGIILLGLSIFRGSYHLPYFLTTEKGFFVTVLIVYGIVLITNVNTIIHGFSFKRGINYDLPIAFGALLVLAHTSAILLNYDIYLSNSVYASASAFAMLLTLLGKCSMVMRIIRNYDFLTNGIDKYSVENIVNEVDATIISRNLLAGEPLLKYSVKTDMPTSFLEIAGAYEPADKSAKILFPVMLVLNIALTAVTGFMQKDWYYAVNVFVAGMVITCPVVPLLATNLSLLRVSRPLEEKGAMVNGFEGVRTIHKSNALVMEASDLFSSRSCDLYGIRLFNKTKVDDALLLTAAVIMKTKSPLKHVFDDVIVGKQAILPEVDTVIYEEKMGTSAWIYQKKVLVGNRDLLIRHGISVPKEDYENKYATNGRKALYLAVAGKIAAMFIVSYSADNKLKKELNRLEKSGITVLLKSCDPYINEESVMEIFGVPEGFIRVMTSSNARIFEKYSGIVVEKSPAYAVHDGSALGFLSAVRASENLISTENILMVLTFFGSALAFGVAALLSFLEGLNQLNVFNVIIFQSVWSIIILLTSKIRRNGI